MTRRYSAERSARAACLASLRIRGTVSLALLRRYHATQVRNGR